MEILIRAYHEADFDAVTEIWVGGYRSYTGAIIVRDETLTQLRKRLPLEIARGWSVYVAAACSEVIGFLALHEDKLEQLFVKPTMQRNNVGKMLLDFAKRRKPDGFWLTTAVANSGSNRFYEREGLKRGEITPHKIHGYPVVRFDWIPL